MPRKRAVLRAVDRLRAVLDARADRKGLRLHRDARLGAEHLERVARAVADREHHVARLQRFARAAAREHNAAHRAVPHEQVLHLRVKAHFSAETPDLLADRAHGLREPVGSDVRLRLEEDFLRRAVLGERLQDKKDALVLCAGIQLAVRKRAGAALAELHVAFAVERAVLPEALHGVLPVLDRAAALHDDRPQPGAGQQEAGEHAGRPEADDDRTQGQRAGLRHFVAAVRRGAHAAVAQPGEQLVLAARNLHVDRHDEFHVAFPARIDGPLDERQTFELLGRKAQLLRRRAAQIGARIPERHRKISYADHRFSPFLRMASAAALPAARPVAHAKCRL